MFIKGKYYENIISNYLIKQGFSIVKRNFYSKFGEIDLIAYKDKTLFFIEVKGTKSKNFELSRAINKSKINKINKTIFFWLNTYNIKKYEYVVKYFLIYDSPKRLLLIEGYL